MSSATTAVTSSTQSFTSWQQCITAYQSSASIKIDWDLLRRELESYTLSQSPVCVFDAILLGRGKNKAVFLGALLDRFQLMADAITNLATDDDLKNVKHEIAINSKLSEHPNCFVQLLASLCFNSQMHMFLEYMPLGSLDEYLNNHKLDQSIIKRLINQVLIAIDTLHSLKILHRDIKTENLLLNYDLNGELMIKVADFGTAAHFADLKEPKTTPLYAHPELSEAMLESKVLTSEDAGKYKSYEMWAIGLVLYRMLYRMFFPSLFIRMNRTREEVLKFLSTELKQETIDGYFPPDKTDLEIFCCKLLRVIASEIIPSDQAIQETK